MTLKELQSMIKEEFEAFTNEAEDELDVSVSDADVDVDAEMGDEMDDAGDEDILRKIYDMLKDKFEGEEEAGDDMDDMDGAEEDVEETYMETKEADLEEGDGYDGKAGKGGTGYDQKVGGKGSTGYDASSKALQERFKKLANIIK